jgi:hypothetical protein
MSCENKAEKQQVWYEATENKLLYEKCQEWHCVRLKSLQYSINFLTFIILVLHYMHSPAVHVLHLHINKPLPMEF